MQNASWYLLDIGLNLYQQESETLIVIIGKVPPRIERDFIYWLNWCPFYVLLLLKYGFRDSSIPDLKIGDRPSVSE